MCGELSAIVISTLFWASRGLPPIADFLHQNVTLSFRVGLLGGRRQTDEL